MLTNIAKELGDLSGAAKEGHIHDYSLKELAPGAHVGILLGHEQVVWSHLTSDGHPFQLGGFDDFDLFLPGHVANVDGSVVELGQEDGSGSRPAFSVDANRTSGVLKYPKELF